jgi:ATP-binding cassette subfamily C protein CydC
VFSAIAVTWLAGAVSLGVLAAAVLASVLGGRLIRRRLLKPAAQIQDALGELKDAFVGLAQATPELRCYGLEDWAAQAINRKGERVAALRVQRLAAEGAASLYQGAVSAVAISLIILAAGHVSLLIAGLTTLAVLSALETVAGLVRMAEQDGAVRQAALRLEPLMRPQPGSLGRRSSLVAADLAIGEVAAQPGLRLALTGASGVGKTTLLDQLVGLRASAQGQIRLGDVDITDLDLQALRQAFAYAPQEVRLITGSVRDNLLLADETANDSDLWAVLHDAGLDERIRANAEGLDQWIGDDGQCLSGGERRRLALARALLRPAPWLLLDEPTEGLDARTEALVIQRLQHRLARTGQGLILVTHRPAALALADHRLQLGKAGSSLVLEGPPSPHVPMPLGLQTPNPHLRRRIAKLA